MPYTLVIRAPGFEELVNHTVMVVPLLSIENETDGPVPPDVECMETSPLLLSRLFVGRTVAITSRSEYPYQLPIA